MECEDKKIVTVDNTEIPCNGSYLSSKCIVRTTGIDWLDIPPNSTLEEINDALVNALIALSLRVTELENA